MKKYASHYIQTIDNQYLKQYIVEISDGQVIGLLPLLEEVESVEWLPGIIELKSFDDKIVAYHLFPFDFTLMQPVDETQRKQLL